MVQVCIFPCSHPDFENYFRLALMWLVPLGMIDPCIIQRLLMSRSKSSLRKQYLLISVFDPAFQIIILLIGLSGLVLYPHIEGSTDTEVFFYLALTFGLDDDPPAAVARAIGFMARGFDHLNVDLECLPGSHDLDHPTRLSDVSV